MSRTQHNSHRWSWLWRRINARKDQQSQETHLPDTTMSGGQRVFRSYGRCSQGLPLILSRRRLFLHWVLLRRCSASASPSHLFPSKSQRTLCFQRSWSWGCGIGNIFIARDIFLDWLTKWFCLRFVYTLRNARCAIMYHSYENGPSFIFILITYFLKTLS